VISVFWTEQARDDLLTIRTYISSDSTHYADLMIDRLLATADQIAAFPKSGRVVPEWNNPAIREIIRPPYRVVYRIVSADTVHVLTVHHSARQFPPA
jgi:addiction module RelE/StbE family toxin